MQENYSELFAKYLVGNDKSLQKLSCLP